MHSKGTLFPKLMERDQRKLPGKVILGLSLRKTHHGYSSAAFRAAPNWMALYGTAILIISILLKNTEAL